MKCSECGEKITVFRVVGVCDFNGFMATDLSDSNGNIPLLVGSSFIPIAMLSCACGRITFITVKSAIEAGLSQDGHARGEATIPSMRASGHGE